jgi:membrane-associated phospholipid phosphatase
MKQPPAAVTPLHLHLPGRSWWLLAGSAFVFAVAITLGIVAKLYGSPGPDLLWDEGMARDRTTARTGLSLALNTLFSPAGDITILLLGCIVLALAFRRPLTALAFGSLTSVGWLSSEIGKLTVSRLRPPSGATHALLLESGHTSFPSGHTAFAAALAWAVLLVLARTRTQRIFAAIGGMVLTIIVGLSRLYLGVHYPSDVVGSVLISTAGVLLWLPLWNNLIEPRLRENVLIGKLTAPAPLEHQLTVLPTRR